MSFTQIHLLAHEEWKTEVGHLRRCIQRCNKNIEQIVILDMKLTSGHRSMGLRVFD